MTIHIAGPEIRVGSRVRQLCVWCGFRLVDLDLENTFTLSSDDAPPQPHTHTWKQFTLVEVQQGEGVTSYTVVPDEGDSLPLGCCANQQRPGRLRLVDSSEGI